MGVQEERTGHKLVHSNYYTRKNSAGKGGNGYYLGNSQISTGGGGGEKNEKDLCR